MKKKILECKLCRDYSRVITDRIRKESNHISIDIKLTSNCSYKCKYCTVFTKDEEFAPLQNLISMSEVLLRAERDSYDFYIYGGEPSLYPHFHQFISHIHQTFILEMPLLVQTNLYRAVDFYLGQPVKYLVSYHPAKTTLKVFEPKVRKLYQEGSLGYVDFMLEDHNRSRIREEFLQLKASEFGHLIRPRMVDNIRLPEYEDFLDAFRPLDRQYLLTYEDGETVVVPRTDINEISFKHMTCEAKHKRVVLAADGSYWYCKTQMDSRLPSGNLLQNPDRFLKFIRSPVICTWDRCICDLDLRKWRERKNISKTIPGKTAQKYPCGKPFTDLILDPKMDFYLCRRMSKPVSIGNAVRRSVKEAWNSPAAVEIRQSVLDGSFTFCSGCPFLEVKTGPQLQDIVENRTAVLENGPQRLVLANDQSCNLACPACRTGMIASSSPIRYEVEKYLQEKVVHQLRHDLEELVVSGMGDPFASSHYIELLAGMKQKYFPRLRISLDSNGLLFDQTHWDKIRGIHRAVKRVRITIDAAGPGTYRLNKGGDWQRLNQNLQFISQLHKQGVLEKFEIAMTVQRNNWREMPQFIDMGRQYGADIVFMPLKAGCAFEEKEYFRRAVHLDYHPENLDLAELLAGYSQPPGIDVQWGFFEKFLAPYFSSDG